jgi:ligand-binding SRPBCC domain-containing protein
VLDLIPSRRWVRIERRTGSVRDGDRVTFSIGVGLLRVVWEASHYGYVRGRQFCDEQVRGPFRTWRHTHRIEAVGASQTLYEDRIEYALPGGPVVHRLLDGLVQRLLTRAFARRHQIVRASLSSARLVKA